MLEALKDLERAKEVAVTRSPTPETLNLVRGVRRLRDENDEIRTLSLTSM